MFFFVCRKAKKYGNPKKTRTAGEKNTEKLENTEGFHPWLLLVRPNRPFSTLTHPITGWTSWTRWSRRTSEHHVTVTAANGANVGQAGGSGGSRGSRGAAKTQVTRQTGQTLQVRTPAIMPGNVTNLGHHAAREHHKSRTPASSNYVCTIMFLLS